MFLQTEKEILINPYYARTIVSVPTDTDISHPVKVISKITTKDLFNKIMTNPNYNYILPRNCKFFKVLKNSTKVLIIEEEPKIRTIHVSMDLNSVLERHKLTGKYEEYNLNEYENLKPSKINGYPRYKFSLSIPYVIYVINIDSYNNYINCRIFFRLHPITSFNDYLLYPSLSNLNDECNVCIGHIDKKSTIHEVVDEIVGKFWLNDFNRDYYNHVNRYSAVLEISDYFTWNHNTKVDPFFIFSTKWLPYPGTIQNILDHLVSEEIKMDTSKFDIYKVMESISMTENIEDGLINEEVRNYSESIVLDDGLILSIGDELSLDNIKYYIYSFNHKYDTKNKTTTFKTIILEKADDGNLVEFPLNHNNQQKLIKSVQIKNPTSVKINDFELSVGDLVQFSFTSELKMVDKIIRSRDGIYQIKIGKDFYLISPFIQEKIKKIDPNFIKFGNVVLESNKKYIVGTSDRIFSSGTLLTYKNLSTVDNKVTFLFKDEKDRSFNVNVENNSYSIKEESFIAPLVLRFNNNLVINEKNTIGINKNSGFVFNGFIKNLSVYYDRFDLLRYNSEVCMSFLKTISNCLEIKSFDFDIDFKIGDDVIVVDWENQNEMLKIKTIENFSIIKNDFNVVLKDDKGNIENFKFIDISEGTIQTGKLRKVCRELNNVKINTKVVAKISGIYDFPKKDCNEIKAFIIDGVEPRILFSNYRTLPFEEIVKFDLFTETDPKFNKLKVTEEVKNINIQPGDFIYSKFYKMASLVNKNKDRSMTIGNPLNDDSFYHELIGRNIIRYGILGKRYSKTSLSNMRFRTGFPGMLEGVITESDDSIKCEII